jgi:large subunit ribosomal protein L29
MKAADLREKTPEDLRELQKSLLRDVFQNRLKNFTNRLDDTSTIGKTKRDLARVITVLREQEIGVVRAKPADKAEAAEAQPKAKKPKAAPKVEAQKNETVAVEAPAETKAEKPKKSAKVAASVEAQPAEAAEPAKKKSSSTKAKKEAR